MAADDQRGISRRDFMKGAAAGVAIAAGGAAIGGGAAQAATGSIERAQAPLKKPPKGFDGVSWHLHDGKFVDYRGVVAKEVVVEDGVITKVGKGPDGSEKKNVMKVDLKGATVIPGLIDSHVHFMRCGQNPGHEVRIIETATSIAELQQLVADRAGSVPSGEWITCIGGWNRNGLAEKRLPTAAELDAAAPSNPVYLSQTGGGAPVCER